MVARFLLLNMFLSKILPNEGVFVSDNLSSLNDFNVLDHLHLESFLVQLCCFFLGLIIFILFVLLVTWMHLQFGCLEHGLVIVLLNFYFLPAFHEI